MDNVEFYNLGAVEEIPGHNGNGLVRIPASVRNKLNERARFIGMDSVGIEMRFITEAPNIDLYVSVQKPLYTEKGNIRVYKGNFLHQVFEIEPGKVELCRILPPSDWNLTSNSFLYRGRYSPDVWRIVFNRSTFTAHGINTNGHDLRLPEPTELPKYQWLAYGSSITNAHLDGYVHIAAEKLGVQVQNKGLEGACQMEKEMVDYILDNCFFDFITCELGINMRKQYTEESFRKRAVYLINRLIELGKPSVIISVFPNGQSPVFINESNELSQREAGFNGILEELVEKANSPYIKLLHVEKTNRSNYDGYSKEGYVGVLQRTA